MFSKLAIGLLAATSALASSAPMFTQTTLFEAGVGGYKLYRIPGIVVTKAGTVLAYAEARRNTGGDWDTIDIVLRRSTDGGASFSEPRVIGHLAGKIERNPVAIERKQGKPDDVTYNNPVAIADRNGKVHFLFCVEYMRVFYMRSDDDGQTFSTPVEVTTALDSFRPAYAWRVVATGPGHGIQLRNGRLLVPIWLALGTTGNGHGPSVDATMYSDDHGKTWHHGDIAIHDSAEVTGANETAAIELADGRVMLNARGTSTRSRRIVTIGKDGARGWSQPSFLGDLAEPMCEASLVRLSTRKSGGRNRILFSNPDNLTRADGTNQARKDRKNVTVQLSYDEGATWTVKRAIEPGPSAYSDLAVLPDHTVLCFYESAGRLLRLARFDLAWLTEGKDTF